MKYIFPLLIALLIALPARAANADYSSFTLQNVKLQQGTREILLNAAYESAGSLSGGIDAELGFGYFIKDFIELGLTALWSDNDFGNGFGFRGFGEYNYDTLTNWIPFLGASLGYQNLSPDFLSEDTSGIELRVYAGGKIFLTEYLALTGTLGASAATDDVYLDNVSPESSRFDAKLGVRVWF